MNTQANNQLAIGDRYRMSPSSDAIRFGLASREWFATRADDQGRYGTIVADDGVTFHYRLPQSVEICAESQGDEGLGLTIHLERGYAVLYRLGLLYGLYDACKLP